jgi:hypothetical protein
MSDSQDCWVSCIQIDISENVRRIVTLLLLLLLLPLPESHAFM